MVAASDGINKLVEENRQSKHKRYGIFEGIVEYTNDPLQLGRIRIRHDSLYGPVELVATDDLPWAAPCLIFGGGHDYGAIMIPPVGSSVWFMFLYDGNINYPIWLGTRPHAPDTEVAMLRNPKKTLPKAKVSMSPDPKQPWMAPPGPDLPGEFLQMVNNRPERHVPFKTPKGAAIDIEDRDEQERLSIHDRSGQGIFLESNIKEDEGSNVAPGNKNNKAQRGLRSASRGDQLPIDSTYAKEASISIVDLSGQHVTLLSDENANEIKIVSRDGYSTSGATFGCSKETPGLKTVSLSIAASDNQFVVEVLNGNEVKGKIRIDGTSGELTLETKTLLTLKAKNVIIEGNVDVTGDVNVSKSLIVNENGIFGKQVISTRENKVIAITTPAEPSL